MMYLTVDDLLMAAIAVGSIIGVIMGKVGQGEFYIILMMIIIARKLTWEEDPTDGSPLS